MAGVGKVGAVAAEEMHMLGCKVIAVSDVNGGYHNKNGLNIPELIKFMAKMMSQGSCNVSLAYSVKAAGNCSYVTIQPTTLEAMMMSTGYSNFAMFSRS